MEKLRQFYCRLDKKGEHLEKTGYIFTYGYGANRIGNRDYIRLDHIIDTMYLEINKYNKTIEEHENLFKEWEEYKNHDDYYTNEDERLSKIEDNLYNYYYENVYAILTNEEVNEIQKRIGYDFMSVKFVEEMIAYLKNIKLERVA